MLNAAVAKEAYDPDEANDEEQDARMVHPKWRRFRAGLRASEWHRLLGDRGWPEDDARRLLTWKGRFERVVNTGSTKVTGAGQLNASGAGTLVLNDGALANDYTGPTVVTGGGSGINLAIAGIAALNLVLDFDRIEQGVQSGSPKQLEWFAAFGLMVTLIWLYLELLRLLSRLQGRRN